MLLLVARTAVNMTRRFAYPFLPSISRSLGVPLGSVQSVLALQSATGLSAPFMGPYGDRYGRKRVMLACLLLLTLAGVVGFLLPQFTLFAVVMVAFGLAKSIFDPSVQAYIAEIVPYKRRGRAMGIIEFSWSLGLVVGAPIAALTLALGGIRWFFLVVAVAGVAAMVLLQRRLPSDAPTDNTDTGSNPRPRPINPLTALRIVAQNPAALLALGYSVLLAASNEIILITYAAWFSAQFGVAEAALGVTAIAIATAEIVGEISVVQLADRIGKRRLALLAMTSAALSYAVLPLLSFSLVLAVLWLFVIFVGVETAIVASFPLFTEVMPSARAALMSSVVSAHSVGRLSGAVIGGGLYATVSYPVVGVVALVMGLAGAGCMWALRLDENAV